MNFQSFDGISYSQPDDVQPAVDHLDSRPRLVLVVGNGFSMGWAAAVNKHSPVNIGQLYPQSDAVPYRPYPFDDDCAAEPLSSNTLFPQMHSRFSGCKSDEESWEAYCEMLVEIAKQTSFSEYDNRLIIKTCSLSTEFRVHTWNTIAHFQDEFAIAKLSEQGPVPALHDSQHWWSWPRVFRTLAEQFRVTIVSFNYDTLVQDIFSYSVNELAIERADQCAMWLRAVGGKRAVVLKPHGGVNWTFAPGIAMQPHFWLEDSTYLWQFCRGMYKVRQSPSMETSSFPVIVPPGCGIEHMVCVGSDLIDATRSVFRDAAAIVSVGFRGAPPDTTEIQDYLSGTKDSCVGVSVGLPGDEQNEMSQMLIARCGAFRFHRADSPDGAGEVSKIPGFLDRNIVR